jgi:hypothetical protein
MVGEPRIQPRERLLDDLITDESLRKCINKRCKKGKVVCVDECDKDDVLGYAYYETIGGISTGLNKGYLCMKNIAKHGMTHKYGEIAIHEWAHTCGWDEGDGKGVPGDTGGISP